MLHRGRKKVQWKDGETNTVRAKNPYPYTAAIPLPAELEESYNAALVEGSLWTTAVGLRPEDSHRYGAYEPHEYPYLIRDYGYRPEGGGFPAGTMAVYTGVHRVSEGTHGNIVRIPRHSFLIGGTRYITVNLADFVPVGW